MTSHAGDDWRVCRDHVKARIGIPLGRPARELTPQDRAEWAAKRRAAEQADEAERQRRRARAEAIWDEAQDPRGTLVATYLSGRGLELQDDVAGSVLRFHAACPWKRDDGATVRIPAMVAIMRDIRTNEINGIHRTVLDSTGSKLGRKMLGIATGAAIKLAADDAVQGGLTIGEGIETVLTARALGFRPAWALGSVDAIRAFPVLSGIEALTLLEEIDGGASVRAVEECGQRWHDVGREVSVVRPRAGSDLNDAIREVAA